MDGSSRQIGNHALNSPGRSKATSRRRPLLDLKSKRASARRKRQFGFVAGACK